jgi:hypothetical protein
MITLKIFYSCTALTTQRTRVITAVSIGSCRAAAYSIPLVPLNGPNHKAGASNSTYMRMLPEGPFFFSILDFTNEQIQISWLSKFLCIYGSRFHLNKSLFDLSFLLQRNQIFWFQQWPLQYRNSLITPFFDITTYVQLRVDLLLMFFL